MCFAEQVFFARLGARSVAPQRRAYARRAARRRVQWTWYVHNVFTEPTGRKSVPARAKRRRTRTRIALLTVHNSSSCFLCPWHRACAASPCLPRPCKVASCFETWCMDPLDTSAEAPLDCCLSTLLPGCICRSSPFSLDWPIFWEALRASSDTRWVFPIPVEFFPYPLSFWSFCALFKLRF